MIAAALLLATTALAPGDDAPSWYEASIAPFLELHCTGCHGDAKRKSGLALHTFDELSAGGRGGPVIVPGDAAASALVARMRLPAGDDEHMPPPDVAQPSADAIADVAAWIDAGATRDLPAPTRPDDAPPAVAAAPDAPAPIDAPFPHAAVDALRTALAHVEVVDPARRTLWVDLRARPATTDADVGALVTPLGPYVVELSLARTAVTDAALTHVARLPNLERLDLSRTAVSARGLAALADHASLRALVLTGTAVDDAALATVASLPRLERLAVWRTPWSADATRVLGERRPAVRVVDAAPLVPQPLETEAPPTLSRLPALPAVNAACPVSGAPVDSRYRVAHDGRIVGFCCPDCAVAFWASPSDFEVVETAPR